MLRGSVGVDCCTVYYEGLVDGGIWSVHAWRLDLSVSGWSCSIFRGIRMNTTIESVFSSLNNRVHLCEKCWMAWSQLNGAQSSFYLTSLSNHVMNSVSCFVLPMMHGPEGSHQGWGNGAMLSRAERRWRTWKVEDNRAWLMRVKYTASEMRWAKTYPKYWCWWFCWKVNMWGGWLIPEDLVTRSAILS